MPRRRRYGTVQPYRPRNTRDVFTPRPAPLQPNVLQPDPAYDLGVGAANRNYEIGTADIGYQQSRLGQSYGFGDTTNPFNQQAMLQRAYQQGQRGNLNQMAAGGQLYAGALQRQQDEGTFQYQRSHDTLRREFEDRQQQLTSQQAQLGATRSEQLAALAAERLDRAIAQRPSDPGPPPRPRPKPKGKKKRKSYDSFGQR